MVLNNVLVKAHFEKLELTPKMKPQTSILLTRVPNPVQQSKLLKLAEIVMEKQWKLQELVGPEVLISISKCFKYYGSIIISKQKPLRSWSCASNASPLWITRNIAVALLNHTDISLPDSPFAKILSSIINSVGGLFSMSPDLDNFKEKNDSTPRSVLFITEGSDLDAVVDITLQTIFDKNAVKDYSLHAILVQESLLEAFYSKLIFKYNETCHKWANSERAGINKTIEYAKQFGARVIELEFDAAIVYNLKPPSWFSDEPTLFLHSFRTITEGAKLAATLDHFCAASIWGNDVSLSLSFAKKFDCTNVWLNSFGRHHPAVPICRNTCSDHPAKGIDVAEDLLKLLHIDELAPFHRVIQRWANITSGGVPDGIPVLVRKLGSLGEVWVDGKNAKLAVINTIAALACGNQVRISTESCNEEESVKIRDSIKEFLRVLPPNVLTIEEAMDSKAGHYFLSHEICSVDDLVHNQYIWLPDPQSL